MRRYAGRSVVIIAALAAGAMAIPTSPHAAVAGGGSSGTLFGASVPAGTLAAETAEFGHMPVVRVFYTGLPPANAWTTGAAGANRSGVVVSFKDDPRNILSGAADGALNTFFATAPRTVPVWFSYIHEPEDQIAAGLFTAADYRAAWTHIGVLAARAGNPQLRATLILMSWSLNPMSHRNWQDYFPGSAVINTLGWDAYPHTRTVPSPPADFMGPAVAVSKSMGMPFGFAEFGETNPVGRPAWLTDIGVYLHSQGASFGTYFNSTVGGNYPLTDAASQSAWRAVVATSGSVTPVPTPVPTPLPTPVPTPLPTPVPTPLPTPLPTPVPTPLPTPVPTPLPTPVPTPVPTGVDISAASLSPASFDPGSSRFTTVAFTVSMPAHIWIDVVSVATGRVVRNRDTDVAVPQGPYSVNYYGFVDGGTLAPAGQYRVLITAVSASGSRDTASLGLTLN